jgi:hypothetical protein
MLRRQKKTFGVATQNPKFTCKNLTELSEYSELNQSDCIFEQDVK